MLAAPSKQELKWEDMDQHSLTRSLNLPEFEVTQLAVEEEAIHLRCRPVHAVGICPECGAASGQVHEQRERVVRDVAMNGKAVYLHLVRRRFRCPGCEKVFTERVASIDRWRRYTRRYEQALYEQCRQRARKHVAHQHGLGEATMLSIFVREAERVLARREPPRVRRLGIDEIALKKRHQQYALVLTDLDRPCVIAVLPDRKQAALETWLRAWTPEQRAAVEVVSTDLWEPFRQAIRAVLPQARHVADRFHVMRQLNRRLNQARSTLARTGDAPLRQLLQGTRWALVKNPAHLTEKEAAHLQPLLEGCPLLRDLYLLKEEFRTICNRVKTRAQAARFLLAWRYKVLATGNVPLSKFVACLDLWWDEFLNYFMDRTTQAFPEGIHNAMRVTMRRAYGFRNFRYFRLHMLAQHGGV
jgi:transposase